MGLESFELDVNSFSYSVLFSPSQLSCPLLLVIQIVSISKLGVLWWLYVLKCASRGSLCNNKSDTSYNHLGVFRPIVNLLPFLPSLPPSNVSLCLLASSVSLFSWH